MYFFCSLYFLQLHGSSQADPAKCVLRKYLGQFCKALQCAIKHCRDTGGFDWIGLAHDILNIFNHVLGRHGECRAYFCTKKGHDSDDDLITLQSNEKVYNAALKILESVAAEAEKLRLGFETNTAENAFTVAAKKVAGKRINFSNLGSYSRRFNLMILQRNGGYDSTRHLIQKFTGRNPGPIYNQYVEKRENQKKWTNKAKAKPDHVRCSKNFKKGKNQGGYGADAVAGDRPVTSQELDDARLRYLVSKHA